MTNNDILIRLRYALDIKDTDMVKIFKLGGVEITKDEVQEMLTKHEYGEEECSNKELESFLNGFIILKRGEQKLKPGQKKQPEFIITNNNSVNNVILKKLRIALSLKSHDMHEILQLGGVDISDNELSAVFRKEGHRNYVECGDRYVRNFLKGLTMKHRNV